MQGSVGLGKCRRIASDAPKSIFLGHARLGKFPKSVSAAVFEDRATENDEKAGMKPYFNIPRGLKNARKRMDFGRFSKKQIRMHYALDVTETRKTRENALFSTCF